jgi:hypothetical protein
MGNGEIQMTKPKCQMNVTTNPNAKTQISNVDLVLVLIWHLNFDI